ncbi:MAG TPA: class I SAM-dependent methyltransferase [Puia sp.]|jgi:predicted O-methyltransferase YrrM|nr:class I SAM-dependent methyltransferase [Puia sp.]
MKWSDIPGWFDYQQLYRDAVDRAKDGDVLVELGVYLGQSAAYMAGLIKDSGKKVHFYAVDLWKKTVDNDHADVNEDIFQRFWHNMNLCGVSEFITPLQMSTAEAAAYFREREISLDFAFVDANHTYLYVKADLENYKPLIKPGGVLAGHDIYFDAVRKAVDEILPEAEILPSCFLYRVPLAG